MKNGGLWSNNKELRKFSKMKKNADYSQHPLVFGHLHQAFGAQAYADQASAHQN
jgi:hypothetical protein